MDQEQFIKDFLGRLIDKTYQYTDSAESYKHILTELVNTPPIKIPLWIVQNKDRLEKLGIKIKKKRGRPKKCK